MNLEKLFTPVILGTAREGSETRRVAEYLFEKMKERTDLKTEFVDPREFDFKLNDDGRRELLPFQQIVEKSDGFVIVSPEYNHGYPGTLKFLLDQVRPSFYNHRAAAICGVSNGSLGGARMIESLSLVLREFGLVVSKRDLRVPAVSSFFGPASQPLDPEFNKRLSSFLDELVWLAKALQAARKNINIES